MGVASHFGIDLSEYDSRIATFIPRYDEMIAVATTTLRVEAPQAREVLDLGTGTGALAGAVTAAMPRTRVTGIDSDEGMLALATRRLGPRLTPVVGDICRAPFPACDAVISSFALHHIRTRTAKQRVYGRIARALRRGGRLVLVDCFPSASPRDWAHQRAVWLDHLATQYGATGARRIMRTWAREDTYMPLGIELAMLARAGFVTEIAWRRDAFAVLVGSPSARAARLRVGGA